MELSYGQLEMTLATHFRIHPDKIGTFRSRVRQLQRLEFPPDSKVGRGEKIKYSAAQLFQFVAAFELIGAGYPAGLAVKAVTDKWWNFACGFGLAIRHRVRSESGSIVFTRVMNSTLADLQGRKDRAEIPGVFVEDEESLRSILKRNDDRVANSYTLLCTSDIAMNVLDLIKKVAQLDNPLEDAEFSDWHVKLGGREEWWMRAQDGWFVHPLPAGEPPQFISALIVLLEHAEPEIFKQFCERAPYEMQFTEEQLRFLLEHNLASDSSTIKWAQLTRKGLTVRNYIIRALPEDSPNGDD